MPQPMFSSSLFRRIFFIILFTVIGFSATMYLFVAPLISKAMYRLQEESAKSVLDSVYNLVISEHLAGRAFDEATLENFRLRAREMNDAGFSILTYWRNRSLGGEIDPARAKKQALEEIAAMRFGAEDYLFVTDTNAMVLSPPASLPGGTKHVGNQGRLRNAVRPQHGGRGAQEPGGRIFDLLVPEARRQDPQEKMAFSRMFKPWGWVLSSGVYLEDMHAEMQRRKSVMLQELWQVLHSIRMVKNGYIFIIDSDLNLVAHPDPELVGRNIMDMGLPPERVPDFSQLLAASENERPIQYTWNRATDPQNFTYDKIAWAKFFKGFGWFIISSVYEDDVRASVTQLRGRILGAACFLCWWPWALRPIWSTAFWVRCAGCPGWPRRSETETSKPVATYPERMNSASWARHSTACWKSWTTSSGTWTPRSGNARSNWRRKSPNASRPKRN